MNHRYKETQSLLEAYGRKRTSIRERLRQFRAVRTEDYFYELVYCFMTPQSSAVSAAKAQQTLMAFDFRNADVDAEPLLHQKDYYIRFHKTKAKLLKEMKEGYDDIFRAITSSDGAFEKREWLVNNVKGIGFKEATHFLRNIGLNDGLAILDRHILKNLRKHGVIRSLPKTLTKKNYLAIEARFQKYSLEIGIDIDDLDLLFWSNEAGEILK